MALEAHREGSLQQEKVTCQARWPPALHLPSQQARVLPPGLEQVKRWKSAFLAFLQAHGSARTRAILRKGGED